MATIDNLTLEINANNNNAVDNLAKLSAALSALKDASKGISSSNLDKVADAFYNLKYAVSGLSIAAVKRVERLSEALKEINAIDAKQINDVANAIKKIKNVPTVSKSKNNLDQALQLPAVVEPFGTYLPDIIKQLPAVTQAFGSYMPEVIKQLPSVYEAQNNFPDTIRDLPAVRTSESFDLQGEAEKAKEYYGTWREVEEGLANIKFGDILKGEFGKVAAAVKNVTLSYFRKELELLGRTAKKITTPIQKLLKALGRIALYRAIRGLLKGITQGITEGVQNLAIYSKALNELDAAQANKTMSELATAFLYFKNSVGAAVMPIIQQFVPAIKRLVEVCVEALNILNQLISALQGKSTYTRAKVYWVDYAGSLDKATGSAKKLHKQLAAFDELNNLTTNSGSGSGSELDPTQMFEEANIENKWLDTAQKIKETFGDILVTAGLIGLGIAAWKLSSGLLAGLASFGTVGKIAAAGISLGITLYCVGLGLSWKGFLDSLTEGLSTKVMIELLLGSGLQLAGGGALSLGGGGILGVLFAPLLSVINPAIILAPLFTSLITAGVPLMASAFVNIVTKGITLGNSLLLLLGNSMFLSGLLALVGSLAGPVGTLTGMFMSVIIAPIITGLELLLTAFVQNYDQIQQKTVEFLQKLGLEKIAEKVDRLFNRVKPVIVAIDDLFKQITESLTEMKEAAGRAFDKLKETGSVKQAWNLLKTNIVTNLNSIKIKFEGVFDSIKTSIKNVTEDIWTDINNLFSKIINKMPKIDFEKTTSFLSGITTGLTVNVNGYANGGFVQGDLFIANERGAEMVGSVNGNTAVANNQMITEAIAQATYNSMSKALAENNGNVTVVVEGDGEKMFKVWQKEQKNYQRRTGLAF